MNTPTITRVKLFIRIFLLATLFGSLAHADGWTVDFSRRQSQTRSADLRDPASTDQPVQAAEPSFFESLFQTGDVAQEIVVLNTERGFVPNTIRVKKGQSYQIHVVNVNEKEKNVSFVLDSFSEHHSTFYGKLKTFVIRPQKEGVYRYVSPETSAQGKLVVYPGGPETRMPASE